MKATQKIDRGQIILRMEDENGHHIIRLHRMHGNGRWSYAIEGYSKRPENYQKAPAYYMPLTEAEVEAAFAEQGKTFVGSSEKLAAAPAGNDLGSRRQA